MIQPNNICSSDVIAQEKKSVEGEKTFQSFPPEALVKKLTSELPEGVDPTQKEVCVCACFCCRVRCKLSSLTYTTLAICFLFILYSRKPLLTGNIYSVNHYKMNFLGRKNVMLFEYKLGVSLYNVQF